MLWMNSGCICTCACAGDTLGNVALLDIDGKEIWEKHVKSMLGQVGPAALLRQHMCTLLPELVLANSMLQFCCAALPFAYAWCTP